MIHATFERSAIAAAGAELASRTIAGVAVPWNVDGRVADGRTVRFAPGAIDAAGRPVLLRDHDRTRPLGRVVDAADTGAELTASTRVSQTADGNEALTLAGDGVLDAFSVGVEPTAWHHDGDVLVVTAARWDELSLLTFGAFDAARVTRVAAELGPTDEPEPDDDDDGDDQDDDDDDTEPDEGGRQYPMNTQTTAPAELVPAELVNAGAGPARIPVTGPASPARDVGLHEIAQIVAASNQRGLSAEAVRTTINAALTNVLSTPGGAGVTPHAYLTEIRGLIARARATIDAISSAPLPAGGMAVDYPSWKTRPTTGEQVTQKTAIVSTAAEIEMKSAAVHTFAGGNDLALALTERSSPSFVDAYLRAMAADYARQTNVFVINALLATATAVTPAATPTFVGSVAALLAALSPNTTPPGQVFVGMSWDVANVMLGVTVNAGPAFWSGSINYGSGEPNMSGAGINLYADWDLPAKTMLAGTKPGATWLENPGAPADIRVVDVSLLGVDVGVYGYGALTLDYPNGFTKMTFTTMPTGLDDGGTSSRAK